MIKTICLEILAGLLVAACTPAIPAGIPVTSTHPSTSTQPVSREAQVQSVEIQTLGTTPGQVKAVVHGVLPESCATLGESQVQYISYKFRIAVYTVTSAEVGCLHATVPFVTTILLDARDLPPGTYAVIANGASAVFTWPVDKPTSTPIPTNTPTTGVNVTPVVAGCKDAANFVADVTIPDNSVVAANTPFTKTWRLKNIGTCTWDSTYLVANISGTPMSQQPGYWILRGKRLRPVRRWM